MLVVACGLAYLLVDGHPESWLTGLPLRPPSLMLAVIGGIVLWVAWPKKALPPSPLPITMERGRSHPARLPLPRAIGRGLGGRGILLAFLVLTAAKGAVGWMA